MQSRDELNTYHRRSSHTGTSSLDSSSIYALLSFDSSPENECTNSDADSLTVPVDRLRPVYCKDVEKVKCRRKQETSKEGDRTSVTSLVPAVPNQYINSLSSTVGKKHLIVSLPNADESKCTESKTSEDNSVRFSVKDKLSVCNGLMSLLSANGDNIEEPVPASSDKVLLRNDATQAEQCQEINHRRYSCGDQLAATWWRLLDRAASFSDLRVLPRSLSRFCCSTWRTFTGVKSQCIDVSQVGNIQPSDTSRLNVNGINSSVGDEITEQSVSPWWHKPVSPDRRRLIDIGSDVESSLCEDSPRKVDCNRVLLDNAQNLCKTVPDGQLSDSDGGGSYVSLRVNCKSSTCHNVPHPGEDMPHHFHADCDILDEEDTSVMELPTKQTVNRRQHAQKQTGNIQSQSAVAAVLNCGSSVQSSQSSASTTCTCAAVQPTHCCAAVMPPQSFTHSLSSGSCSVTQSDQLLQPNNGYINLSLGTQSSSFNRQSVVDRQRNSSFSGRGQPAKISAETKSVPNLGSDSSVPLDVLAVHVPCSVGKEKLSCDSSSSSVETLLDKFSLKSSNRLLRLIRRSSTKAHKHPVLSATNSAVLTESSMNSTELSAVNSADAVTVTVRSSSTGNDQQPVVHRLPSPDVPPPPVPDDSATSRLFQLCHTSFSEHLPLNMPLDSDSLSQYEDLSVVKSCTAAKKTAALSSSYSAGDKRYYDNQSLKCSTNEDNIRLLARIPSRRRGHG